MRRSAHDFTQQVIPKIDKYFGSWLTMLMILQRQVMISTDS